MGINTDHGSGRTKDLARVPVSTLGQDVTMIPGGSAGQLYQHWPHCSMVLRYQHGLSLLSLGIFSFCYFVLFNFKVIVFVLYIIFSFVILKNEQMNS